MKVALSGVINTIALIFALSIGVVGAQGASSNIDIHRFRAGDGLIIKVFPDTNFLNGTYPIDSDGYADLPLVGMVKVTDKSCDQLSEHLLSTYIQYIRYPHVHTRPAIRVSMLGGFSEPGMYYVDPRSSMWDVLQVAGGPLRRDGLRKLRWERDRSLVSSNLVPYIQSGKSLYNIGFQSGDQIWVTSNPRRRLWEVFTSDIVPVVSVMVSTIATVVTLSQIE